MTLSRLNLIRAKSFAELFEKPNDVTFLDSKSGTKNFFYLLKIEKDIFSGLENRNEYFFLIFLSSVIFSVTHGCLRFLDFSP